MSDRSKHWDALYGGEDASRLSWHEAQPTTSLELIDAHAGPSHGVIDVGAGGSRLIEALHDGGYRDLTALDISSEALKVAQARLGSRAADIEWIAADVTRWRAARRFGVWHDRAAFHFLTSAEERAAYIDAMRSALEPNGVAIIATFAADGPEDCSGLPVMRYSPVTLATTIADLAPGAFEFLDARRRPHLTPSGGAQLFQYTALKKLG